LAAHRLYVGKYISGFFQTIVFEVGSIAVLIVGLALSIINDSWGDTVPLLLTLLPLPILIGDLV
jgi:TM2 domain-containing membrane protein YozV